MSIEQIASKTGLVHFTYPARLFRFIFGRSYPFGRMANTDLHQTVQYRRSAKKEKTSGEINNLTQGKLGKVRERWRKLRESCRET